MMMSKALDQLARERVANVVVYFENDTATDVPTAAKHFREQIKALGVARTEYDFINDDDPKWHGEPRHRSQRFVALTQHAEMIFKLVQP
jgi:hypothetical protein